MEKEFYFGDKQSDGSFEMLDKDGNCLGYFLFPVQESIIKDGNKDLS